MLRHLSRPPREDRQMFVCLIDVDQFKAINDQYGHDMGDHALRQTADILLQLSQRATLWAASAGMSLWWRASADCCGIPIMPACR